MFQLDDLVANNTASVVIVARTGPAGQTVNSTSVSAVEVDPVPANNSSVVSVTIHQWRVFLPLVIRLRSGPNQPTGRIRLTPTRGAARLLSRSTTTIGANSLRKRSCLLSGDQVTA